MANEAPKPDPPVTGLVQYRATEGIPIHYADSFLVGTSPEIFLLNFYQTEVPAIESTAKRAKFDETEATCFVRIALTPIAFRRLLLSMAERGGYKLVTKDGESTSGKEKNQ